MFLLATTTILVFALHFLPFLLRLPVEKESEGLIVEIAKLNDDKDFAKIELLNEKLLHLRNQNKAQITRVQAIRSRISMLIWSILFVLTVICSAEPVFYVPPQFFGPVTSWLKFPFSPFGSVGVFYYVSGLRSILSRINGLKIAVGV